MILDLPLLKAFDNFPIYFGIERRFSTPFVTNLLSRRVHQQMFPRIIKKAPTFTHALLVVALVERIHGTAYAVRGSAMQMVSVAEEQNMHKVMTAIVLARDPCKLVRDIVKSMKFDKPKRKPKNDNAIQRNTNSPLHVLFKAGASGSSAGQQQPAGRRKSRY